jgi:hypothetical protein
MVCSLRTSLLILFPALAVLAACGGSDDASDDSGGASSSPAAKDDATRSSNSAAKIPAIKDGNFVDGTIHAEVSGGKDFKLDAKGNGIATGGFALLTYSNSEGTVILSFQADSKEEPGGVAVTTAELATAGAWGADCTVTVDDAAKELKGEFNCKEIEAVDPKAVKTYKVRVKGTFSASR